MTRGIKQSTIVQDGGRVQIESLELIPGAQVEVIVLQSTDHALPSIDDTLAGYAGGRLFKSAGEVGAYLREERDSRDR